MATNAPAKSAPALGVAAWREKVRELAPEAKIPYIVQIMGQAYEAGLTPQAFVDAIANPAPGHRLDRMHKDGRLEP